MDDTDWNVMLQSEVFRNFASATLNKRAAEQADLEDQLEALENLEAQIKDSPLQLKKYQALQNKLASDAKFYNSHDPVFAEAVLLLNLDLS